MHRQLYLDVCGLISSFVSDYCGEDIPIADQKMAMENNLFEVTFRVLRTRIIIRHTIYKQTWCEIFCLLSFLRTILFTVIADKSVSL